MFEVLTTVKNFPEIYVKITVEYIVTPHAVQKCFHMLRVKPIRQEKDCSVTALRSTLQFLQKKKR